MLKVDTVHDSGEFARLKPEWDALLSALEERGSVFMSHAWHHCWWRHFNAHAALNLLVVRRDGELVGLFPLMRQLTFVHGLPVRSICFMENWNSLHNDALVLPKFRDGVLHAVLETLYAERQSWDVLQLNNIPGSSENCDRLISLLTEAGRNFQLRHSMDTPYLEVAGEWPDFFGSRSTRVRKTLRNIQNGLARSGNWEVLQLRSWQEYLDVREGILQVARKSWTKRIGDSLADPVNAAFFDDLAQAASAQGWLSIWLLRLNGREIAFEFHLRGCNKQHALRASYDAEFAALSPGAFLEMQALKRVFQEPQGVQFFDFGGSFDTYKKRWSDHSKELVSLQVFNQRFYSRLAALHEMGVVPVARSIRDRLRSRHERSESGADSQY